MTVDELMGLADKWACLREARFTVAAMGMVANNGPVDAARAALETALRASIAGPEVEAVVEAARELLVGAPAISGGNIVRLENALAALDAARAGQHKGVTG